VAIPGSKITMLIKTTLNLIGAAGTTPRTLTAGGATAAATEIIGPGATNIVCFVQLFLVFRS
jgi:hypothetical protein